MVGLARQQAAGRARIDQAVLGEPPLTGRELQVLAMFAAGTPNHAIAGRLFITVDTVKKHVGHVLGKLSAANGTEAVAAHATWACSPSTVPGLDPVAPWW